MLQNLINDGEKRNQHARKTTIQGTKIEIAGQSVYTALRLVQVSWWAAFVGRIVGPV